MTSEVMDNKLDKYIRDLFEESFDDIFLLGDPSWFVRNPDTGAYKNSVVETAWNLFHEGYFLGSRDASYLKPSVTQAIQEKA